MTNIEAILTNYDRIFKGTTMWKEQRSFLKQSLTSFEKEIREENKELLEAISKIDRLVSSDPGFEADLILGFGKSKSIDQRVARDWAKIIVETYVITHKLLHSCCGGEKANERRKSLSTKEEGP